MSRGTVTIIGSYNAGLFCKADRLPDVGETLIGTKYWEGGGGKGSNQAVAASLMGASTCFIARVGDDRYGAQALEMYRRYGISADFIRVDPSAHSGIGAIFIDKNGKNMIIVVPGANFLLSEEDVGRAEERIASSSILGCQLENRLEVVGYALRRAHELGVKTLLDPAPAVKLPDDLYPSINYIKPNEVEARILTGIPVTGVPGAIEAGRWLVDRGVGVAIVTLGERGAVVVTPDSSELFEAPRVDAIDTTGAGDVFSGALMAALADSKPLAEAVTFASHAAALSVTRLGVIEAIPSLEEVLAFQ